MESFMHKISKGSRFSQIYIPKNKESIFEAGDTVKVLLLKKKRELFYSKNIPKLKELKELIVKHLFSFLSKFPNINQIFIVGSFLTKQDYRDIDILIITKKENKELESNLSSRLVSKFEINIHLLFIQEQTFISLTKICPLTRSMLYNFVSNKKFEPHSQTEINPSHLKFLLMMPQDILKIKASSRTYYDNIRRLIAIKRFLDKHDLDSIKIEKELKLLLGDFLFAELKNNEPLNKKNIKKTRKIIKTLLIEINKKLKNEQEKNNL